MKKTSMFVVDRCIKNGKFKRSPVVLLGIQFDREVNCDVLHSSETQYSCGFLTTIAFTFLIIKILSEILIATLTGI